MEHTPPALLVHLLLIYRAKAAAIVFSQPTVPYTQAVHMHWHTNLALLGTCFLEKKKKKKAQLGKIKQMEDKTSLSQSLNPLDCVSAH